MRKGEVREGGVRESEVREGGVGEWSEGGWSERIGQAVGGREWCERMGRRKG